MSKSALILDTPKNCKECPCLRQNYGAPHTCLGIFLQRKVPFKFESEEDVEAYVVNETTSPHCPLKRLK